MPQPIPKKILQSNPEMAVKPFYTLLIDGSNLLRISQKDQTISSKGKPVGGIFQFLLQIKLILQKGNFSHVYVMWDGNNSGQLRYNLYPQYKMNRDGKSFNDDNLSPYMQAVNARIANMMNYARKSYDPVKMAEKEKEREIFFWQRDVLIDCLEELYIRQAMCDDVEADDLIALYVKNKKDNEKIVIMSEDRDLSQLISENVILYLHSKKDFITTKNHKEVMGYDYRNVVLKKIICGDASDNIKGIKGCGETTLFKNFPELTEKECTLSDIIAKAKTINEERIKAKKKPLKWAENIVESVTDGIQGDKIYEINRKIIDLKTPLVTEDAKELINEISYTPLSDDRSMETLFQILVNNGVETLSDSNRFSSFFNEFMTIIDREKKYSAKNLGN